MSDTGRSHNPDWPAQIRQFSVNGATLSQPKVFADIDTGLPDGFRLDSEGNIWTSAGPCVNVYNPAGALLGRIRTGQATSNLTFGGARRNRLFITSSQYVYSLYVGATGLQRP